ncbi:MAG: hypothetical protein EXX96DRAFT_609864 [Benjaminiella poitrasii]|nr:MAG: hypothetical protein EXX96DRAFT_609864 [Benjaminiella poitrasii]
MPRCQTILTMLLFRGFKCSLSCHNFHVPENHYKIDCFRYLFCSLLYVKGKHEKKYLEILNCILVFQCSYKDDTHVTNDEYFDRYDIQVLLFIVWHLFESDRNT